MKCKSLYFCSVSACVLGILTAPGFAQSADSNLETVVVTGIRASLEKGLEVKRNATQVVESIAAEDIGKFPDNNVVEALQRISGVQVTDRGGGEVSTLSIRGMSDIETTWNGRKLFTSNGRYFSVQDMPATLVSRLDAYKTRGPEQLESGIGGVIDVKTHRPFDFDGFKFSAQYHETYQEKAGAFDPNVSALISDSWQTGIGKVGAMLNFSYATIHYRAESATAGALIPYADEDYYDSDGNLKYYAGQRIYNTDGVTTVGGLTYSPTLTGGTQVNIWQPGLINGLSEAAGATMTADEYRVLTYDSTAGTGTYSTTGTTMNLAYTLSRDAVFMSDNKGKTTRPNLNIALQWQPTENAVYTFEFMYNGYRQIAKNNMLFQDIFESTAFAPGGDLDGQYSDSISLYDGTNVVSSIHTEDAFGFNSGDLSKGKTNSFVYGFNAQWSVNDRFVLEGDFTYQKSDYDTEFFGTRISRTAGDVYATMNYNGGIVGLDFGDADDGNALLTEASAWNMDWIYDNANTNSGAAYTLKVDGVYDLDGIAGPLKKVSFGIRYDDRGASAGERTSSNGPTGDTINLADVAAENPGMLTYNSKFFKGVSALPRSWVDVAGTYMYKHRNYFRNLYGGNIDDPLHHIMFETFSIDEINTAAYVSADFEQDVFDNPLTLNAGIRWVEIKDSTKFWDYDTFLSTEEIPDPDSAGSSVHEFLPSLTLTYSPFDSLKFRFNFGETLRNASFSDLNPSRTLNADITNVGYATGSQGNPNLKPTKSKNYDLTAEWYFAKNSALYTTFFRRDISGLVVTENQSLYIAGDDVETAYNTNNFVISKPMNASKGWLKGIEVGTVYFPDYLPGYLDGLGFQGSMTFLGSSQNVPETDDTGAVTEEIKQSFYGISSVSYNTTLIYEHGPFSSRVSYVWRSHWHNADEAASFANPLGMWRRGEASLDMQASYDIGHGAMFTFDAVNLLNGKMKQYYANNGSGGKNISNYSTELYDRSFTLGFRFETN